MAPATNGTSAAETPGGSDPADDPDRADEGGGDERVQPDPWSRLASADGDHLQPGSWSRLDSADSEQLQPNLWSGLDQDDRRDQLDGSVRPANLNESTRPLGVGRGLPSRYLALLRIDVEALHRGRVAGDEICEIRGVGPVTVPVAEGLLGQSVLKLVITRGVDVFNVTHLGRGPTAAQKVALAWTTPGCTVEGCYRSRIEHDHRQPWVDTQHTRLDELDPLCGYHHDLKTHHNWVLVPGSGKRPMVGPNDPRHPGHRNTSPRRTLNAASAVPNAPPADAA